MLPSNIKIGPLTYEVVEVEGLRSNRDESLLGEIIYNGLLIKIEKNMAARIKTATLLHEIIHGVLCNAGYMDHDEGQIDAISHGILAALDDNWDLRVMVLDA